MIGKFVGWFIVYGLSFLVSNVFGWAEQGKAFFCIHFGVFIAFAIVFLAMSMFALFVDNFSFETTMTALSTIGIIAITILAIWGAPKIFDVDFYVAYQIMTFGQCLCIDNKQND